MIKLKQMQKLKLRNNLRTIHKQVKYFMILNSYIMKIVGKHLTPKDKVISLKAIKLMF